MRDGRKSEEYWTAYLADTTDFIEEVLVDAIDESQEYKNRIGDWYEVERLRFDVVSALYSSGSTINECVNNARLHLIEAYPMFVSVCQERPKQAQNDYAGGWDFRTRYLALAVLSGLSTEEASPLVKAVDFWPERDALWEVFIAHLGHADGRERFNGLVWAEAYEDALAACDPQATDFDRQIALKQFDDGWLKNMRSSTTPFYSSHNNKHNTYVGYWNFEAAAIAAMFDIDDAALSSSPTYPLDWAQWAKKS